MAKADDIISPYRNTLRALAKRRSGEVKVKQSVWIDERDVLALHDRLLSLHGGAEGLRDAALLKSALAGPQQHLAYAESPDIIDLAADLYNWHRP